MSLSARLQVLSCTRCCLRDTCSSPVPWHGPAPGKIAVIGEAPGENEDRRGIPFCGRAGRLLDTLWRQSSLPTPSLMNVVSCRPPENRNPTDEEIAACRPNFFAQLQAIDPDYVLALGQVALSAVRPGEKVAERRGRPWWVERGDGRGQRFLATYHPAYALRTPDAMKVIATDLNMFKGLVGGWWPETCGCGADVVFYASDGEPRCSVSCTGRMCCKCRKPATWEVIADGKRWLMCPKHKSELEHYRGVEVRVA